MTYQSGFVSIIGSPNVGKSTLMNRLVGQKVSIVSPKAQTTRNRIMGVVTRPGFQIVFLDTPGVAQPRNKLGQYMLDAACQAMDEVDLILFVADAAAGVRDRDEALLARLTGAKAKKLALINKTDAAGPIAREEARAKLEQTGLFEHIHAVSARSGEGVEELVESIRPYLPEGPRYFPEDMVTDQPERLVCAELIREKLLLNLREEVPHGVGVDIEQMALREDGGIMDISALIYCEREAHKAIVIGKNGAMLKAVGTQARRDMEWLLGVKVNLQLHVKVRKDWRNSASALRELGYD